MKKIRLIAIIIAVLAGTAVIFYACQKEDALKTRTSGVKSAASSNLENPFEQYGIWHNECLHYMFSRDAGLSADELWEQYGTEFFRNVLGPNYNHVPLDILNENYNRSVEIVRNRNYMELLDNLVGQGRVNREYAHEGLVTRNNYYILKDYFEYLIPLRVDTEEQYWASHQVICDTEQEILQNYYSLLRYGEIEANPEVKKEYEGVMACMAISRSSSSGWPVLINVYGELEEANSLRAQSYLREIDFTATTDTFAGGTWGNESLQAGTQASGKAGKGALNQ